jgi:hypothetical protein
VLSAAATFPFVCFVQLFIRYVAVCCVCVCVCVSDVLVCGTSGCVYNSHIPDKQLDEANKWRCSSGTKHGRKPLRMVKQW